MPPKKGEITQDQKNILVIVFDAFSAENLSFINYPRDTTPNLNRLLNRAVVYHNHYSNGSFTTPGTASLLTGVVPWTHRAFRLYDKVVPSYQNNNIFGAFHREGYHSVAYTHNPLANVLLTQFNRAIEEHVPISELFIKANLDILLSSSDFRLIHEFHRILLNGDKSSSVDLFFSQLIEGHVDKKAASIADAYKELYPGGTPRVGYSSFVLEDSIDWMIDNADFPQPFFGYFHFFPPHHPYKPRKEFVNIYDDIVLPDKPDHILNTGYEPETLYRYRKNYDQNIAYADYEFNRLFNFLDKSGKLENTIIVLTSDHGEIFERGIWGHWDKTLHQPLIHVPLVIFEPGRTERVDIYENTNAVDLLPTLLHMTDKEFPEWTEGQILPPFSNTDLPSDRNIFSVLARFSPINAPLTTVTVSLVKGDYKLTYYSGYEGLGTNDPLYELYDLKKDPQEINNLYSPNNSVFKDLNHILQSELTAKSRSRK